MSIIIAILIFGIIIAIHELGHFIAAKACNVKVNEFAIGMGPAIFKKQKGETLYALRLLPIGGYCAMEGEDASSDDNRAFHKKKVWQRMIITVAGAVMNLILGLVVVFAMVASQDSFLSAQVGGFNDNAVTSQTGLKIGDKIIEVNGLSILTINDLSYALQTDSDGIFDMRVIRDENKLDLKDVKFKMNEDKNGKHSLVIDFSVMPMDKTISSVTSQTFKTFASTARMIWISLGDLITGKFGLNDLSGPVGIVNVIGDVVSQPSSVPISDIIQDLLYLISFITINVGMFNLLPIPALDGGRILFLIVEAVRRKPIKPEKEGIVHFIGLAILLILMLIVTFNDIIKIF